MAVKLDVRLELLDAVRLSEKAKQAGKTLEQYLQEKLVGQMGVVSVKVHEVLEHEDGQTDQSGHE